MIRVVIADDQELVREGFAAILGTENDMVVVGLAQDGKQAAAMARDLAPDVILMDVRMPVLDGVEATRLIVSSSSRAPRVLMLTTFDLDEHVYDAMSAGASGFMLKDLPRGRLAQAVRSIAEGEELLDPALTRRLIERFTRQPSPSSGVPESFRSLTARELEILREVAAGLSNAEIALDLHLSPATVKSHVASILRKLDLRDRVQLVVQAYENGFVQPGQSTPEA